MSTPPVSQHAQRSASAEADSGSESRSEKAPPGFDSLPSDRPGVPSIAQQVAQLVADVPRPLTVANTLPLAYQKLRMMGRGIWRHERAGHTLQPTAVLNEACARLLEGEPEIHDGAHLACLVAQSMRRFLVDHARARKREKRQLPSSDELQVLTDPDTQTETIDVIDIDIALNALAEHSQAAADVAQLHHFFQLSNCEIAVVLKMSERSVDRSLRLAQAWLNRYIERQRGSVVATETADPIDSL